ncbi:membrane-bound PQQ-dependent dehydrogenase, glucose/quinate/shikimate family [Sphingomonas sp. Marseille-Q8236]
MELKRTPNPATLSWPVVIRRVFAGITAALGIALAAGGAWLVVLGGSPYYVLAGIAYLVGAILFWRDRVEGAWILAGVFLLTVLWAVYEAGFSFWPLFPRLVVPAGLASAALFLALTLPDGQRRASRGVLSGLAGAAALVVVGLLALTLVSHGVISPAPGMVFAAHEANERPSDWSAYGRTTRGDRFAPFTQINRSNVDQLKVAWTFRTGDRGPGVDQNTPLQIGNTIYSCSPNDHIAALDADTGVVRWRYRSGAQAPFWQRCRALGYYDAGVGAAGLCAKRIINTTIDARLIALDAATGRPCPNFGQNGTVDLKVGMGKVLPGFYFQTSGPLIARNRIVIGGWVVDNQARGEPSGVIRAFDVMSGELVWAWDLGNPAITKLPPAGQSYTRGTPNMWTTAAYDDKLGLVYAPLGNETPDYYGPGRNPNSDRYNSTLVALDINTGRERWHAQTVHHDIWDYDLPAQPALVDLPDGKGGVIPAVLQTTKRGQIFLFNRVTGAPVSRVVERPVPQRGQVASEHLSPTQPYSVDMPTIGAERLSERKMWGTTMFDQMLCRIAFRQHRYDGDFTPIGLDYSLEQPGNLGGMNWGSVSVDPRNLYAYMVDVRIPNEYKLVPVASYARETKGIQAVDGHGPGPQLGTPYGEITLPWLSVLGVPCNQPPYGTITAVDLKTKRIAWQVPAGTAERSGPLDIPSHIPMRPGMPAYAGPMTTAGGLVFFAGFQDFHIRAYDAATGKQVWQHSLPVGASATPMTYVSPRTGRQYVVLAVGGAAHSKVTGDYLIAFALPVRRH